MFMKHRIFVVFTFYCLCNVHVCVIDNTLVLFSEIVKGNDLSSLSAKKVRRALESRFNADFTDRFAAYINSVNIKYSTEFDACLMYKSIKKSFQGF